MEREVPRRRTCAHVAAACGARARAAKGRAVRGCGTYAPLRRLETPRTPPQLRCVAHAAHEHNVRSGVALVVKEPG